jgi:hypothetical protein
MRGNCRRYALILAAVFLVLLMAGCERKTINDLRAEPGRYANKEVAVGGKVLRSVSVLGTGAYEIDDGTGKLWIISKRGVPREGARIVVKGTIRDAYNLGSIVKLPDVVSSGMVMIEAAHRAE